MGASPNNTLVNKMLDLFTGYYINSEVNRWINGHAWNVWIREKVYIHYVNTQTIVSLAIDELCNKDEIAPYCNDAIVLPPSFLMVPWINDFKYGKDYVDYYPRTQKKLKVLDMIDE